MNADASKICDVILANIKSSNLNFSLTESPFSVQISLRKTFITDKNGTRISGIFEKKSSKPLSSIDRLLIENEDLKAERKHIVQENYDTVAEDPIGM